MRPALPFALVFVGLALTSCSSAQATRDEGRWPGTPAAQRGCDAELMAESVAAKLPEAALARLDRDCVVPDVELAVLSASETIGRSVVNAESNSVIHPGVQRRLMFFAREPVDPDWAPQTEAAIRAALANPSPHAATRVDLSRVDLELTCHTTMCLALARPLPGVTDSHDVLMAIEEALIASDTHGGESMRWSRRLIDPPELGMLWTRKGFRLPNDEEIDTMLGE